MTEKVKEQIYCTVDFLPVMVKGENSREYVVRERHRLRRGL